MSSQASTQFKLNNLNQSHFFLNKLEAEQFYIPCYFGVMCLDKSCCNGHKLLPHVKVESNMKRISNTQQKCCRSFLGFLVLD